MKKLLMPVLKYCRPLYNLYYYLGTWFLNFLKLFLKTDEKLILFNSFGGKKFDDSPRAIYEAMLVDPVFDDYRFVWAFQDPTQYQLPRGQAIRSDSWTYFVTALKARCWITNSSLERGLGFTGKHTFFLNTWHGTPIKKMGIDLSGDNRSFRSKNTWNMDVMMAQSRYEADIFSRAFELKPGVCQVSGLPRNDVLAHAQPEAKQIYQSKLGIPAGKKAILYAPTFREYEKDEKLQCVFQSPIDWTLWEEQLGDSCVILVRAHYEAVMQMPLKEHSGFIRDVSGYESLNELMIAADYLISDYSSIFFDYAILQRPMFCFAYDYEQYQQFRGLYFDIRSWLPGGMASQAELLKLILAMEEEAEYENAVKMTRAFCREFVESCGNGTQNALGMIVNALNIEEKTQKM